LGIKVVGLVLAMAASDTPVLYLSGFVLGIGATKVNVQPLVYDYAPLERRPTYIGLASTAFGLASVVSPLIGGLVAEAFGYIVLFGGSVVLSIVALVLYLILVEEPVVAGRTASAHGAHG
jgi:MFS family permease